MSLSSLLTSFPLALSALTSALADSSLFHAALAADPLGFLNKVLFETWPGRFLQRDFFSNFTVGVSIGVSLTAAGLLMLEQRAKRIGHPVPERTAKWFGISLTVISFLLYFDFFNPNTRYAKYYHRHELYHYYLGSKYFGEIGYDRLYTCTAIAEVELGRGAQIRKREIRDLSAKNLIIPTTQTYIFDDPGQCKNHFTTERWEAFKTDIAWFEQSARGELGKHAKGPRL
jgi:hypothetical protein